jgi:5'-nucleotidase
MGGIARRASLIAQIRKQNPATFVVDAGDLLQGTPYFNIFKGKVEFETMSRAGYDFMTIGNHEFDAGVERLLYLANHHARFSLLSANLIFSQPGSDRLIQPYAVRSVSGWKLGFFGLCVKLEGLVSAKLHRGVHSVEPIAIARRMVRILRETHRCDAVILLSHLGYNSYHGEPGDLDLAKEVTGIDIIIGGHTHTFLKQPTVVKSGNGQITRIYQVGHSGVYLGKIDLHFHPYSDLSIKDHTLPIAP